jgi:hypothetical protein
MSPKPAEIKARLETAKRDLARAEGEHASYLKEAEAAKIKLREVLGCEPGKEREALAELQAEVEKDEAELARLLDEAEAALTPKAT